MKTITKLCKKCGKEYITNTRNTLSLYCENCKKDKKYKRKPFREKKICEICQKEYLALMFGSHKCPKCRKLRHRSFDNLCAGTVGAIGELIISTDLLKKGYEVYRSLSPSSSCDVLILKNGNVKKLEIRTGYRENKNKIIYPKVKIENKQLAIVIHRTNEIIYIPNII